MTRVTAMPAAYAWLEKEPGPKMLVEAVNLYGIHEEPGSVDSPAIMGWAKEVGLNSYFSSDSVPWCGLFLAVIAKRAGKDIPNAPLWALNWAKFGKPSIVPALGDVLTFKRNGGGHVGLYVGEDNSAYHVLGGNQQDQVCITRIAKDRLYVARRPIYSTMPANVRSIHLAPNGVISQNEA